MGQFLIILRGTPASGKSTIAKSLRNFKKKIAWLKVDNFKVFFSDDASSALKFVNGAAVSTLKYLLEQNFSVVMEGVFQETRAIDQAIEIVKEKGIRYIVIELRCSLPALQARDKSREGVEQGIRKPLGDDILSEIYNKLNNSFYPEAKMLDTENKSLEECLSEINNLLEAF
jgi:broad-specificity NMP kinase